MSNLNKSFCSLYYMEVKKDFVKILPIKAIKGIKAAKLGNYFEVYIPKNQWLPNGFIWMVKTQYATEAKASLLSHIIDRRLKREFSDDQYPIVIDCKNNFHNIYRLKLMVVVIIAKENI